ncbi:MAG: MFS transporter [Acidobacteriota bacterium]
MSGVRTSLVALQHRNFRLIWFGLLVSFTGTMMRNAALLWHVSLLVSPERKALALGAVGLFRVVPVILFSLFSGVVADAWDRRRLMLLTNLLSGMISAALAVFAFRGMTALWGLYVLSAAGSAVGAFDLPARQALLPSLVPRKHLANAISLNTMMFQVASVAGPAAAGLVIGVSNVGWAYAIDAASFGVVILALLGMREAPAVELEPGARKEDVSLRAGLEGLRFVFRSPMIRSTMLLDFFATFFSSAVALLPIYAQDILRVGAAGYGWLYAAPAAGALVASIAMVPAMEHVSRRGEALLWAVAGYGGATIVFGLSRLFWLTFGCLAVAGAADTVSTIIRNVIRQLETPDRLRGRMTGVNMVFFMGGPQLGELEAGVVANWFGPTVSVVSGGLGCLLATGWVAATTPELIRYRRNATL